MYKLYIAVMYTYDSDLFKFKGSLINWLEEKWSEKPKGKTQATFLTVYTKLVSSSGCNMKSYILNYSRVFRQKK